MADETTPTASGGTDRLRSFLVGLATDPAALGRFIRDPDAEMSDADLANEDRAVLRSGNPGMIHARLAGRGTAAASPPAVMLVVDMVTDSSGVAEPRVRETGSAAILQFPQQVFPQIVPPQQIFPQQIFPQQVFPQVVLPQLVFPQQVFPQLVFPQQVFPQLVFPQQVFPQLVFPQQVFPQIVAPQLVFNPQQK